MLNCYLVIWIRKKKKSIKW